MGVRELTVVSELLGADVPTGRDLTPEELEVLVDSIAAHPEAWSDLVAFDADERVYASLHRDAHVDVWLLCWTPENDTGYHDHDISSGAVAVVAGTLREHNLAIDNEAIETLVEGGQVFSFGPD